MTTERRTIRMVREGRYIAEVTITLIENAHEWAPYVSPADMAKLDDVRLALRSGDLKSAAKLAKVYELTPVAAE